MTIGRAWLTQKKVSKTLNLFCHSKCEFEVSPELEEFVILSIGWGVEDYLSLTRKGN
jgi:hypothetical protein